MIPTPAGLSVQQYAKVLADALDPLESALKGLDKAKTYKGLDDRVSSVQTKASGAVTALSPITPPAAVASEHARLVQALRAFNGEMGDLGYRVDSRALCTGSAVRARLGDEKATSAVRKSLAAVTAKLPKPRPSLKLPAADQKIGSRPSNGTYIRSGNRSGWNTLKIENGNSRDAVVTLSKGKKPMISTYVRKGKTATVQGVPNGSYTVYFTFGSTWDSSARAFGKSCSFQRFRPNGKSQLKFNNQGWIVTLQRVVGGNSPTDDVDPKDFPDS